MIALYVSGHGFGHASRQIEVINALLARRPSLALAVVSDASPRLFARTVRGRITCVTRPCDTGVAQIDSLLFDATATIARAETFHRHLEARAADEAAWLRTTGVHLVVGDIPPLAFAAARAAGLPSVAIGNFTWDWIYAGFEEASSAPALLPAIRAAYRQATVAWQMPIGGGFGVFPQVRDLPMIARHARHTPVQVRRALGLPEDRPLVLVSFGGYGAAGPRFELLDCLDRWGVVLVVEGGRTGTPLPAGLLEVEEDFLYAQGFRYEDLVSAVDAVVTKPGYGILSECIANGTAMLYTSRGHFPEYDVMVAEMPRYLRCRFIEQEALLGGRWRRALESLLAQPPPPERLPTDGADVAAERLLDMIE